MAKSEIVELLSQAILLKPKDLIINDLKWKYLLWAVYRRKNILLVGYTRCGKTTAAKSVSQVFSEDVEDVVTEEQLKKLQNDHNIKIEKIEKM